MKNKPLNAFSASLPLLLTSKALLNSHKKHIIHKKRRGVFFVSFVTYVAIMKRFFAPISDLRHSSMLYVVSYMPLKFHRTFDTTNSEATAISNQLIDKSGH